MALEPAGVSLQAENFNKYIKQLGRIDTLQQDIFNVKSDDLSKTLNSATKSAKKYERELKQIEKESKSVSIATKGIGLAAAGGAGIAIAAVGALTSAITTLGITAANVFVGIVKEGVDLNRQFELTEKVFTNVFGDPSLGKATVDFLNETADRLRVSRKEAAAFAQTILPRTGGLDEFTELLRLTDIQADTTGQTLGELEFSIREALSGDFVSLKDRFDLGTEQINRIKELTPELGRSQALLTVLGDEFERLGKTDISGTLNTNIKDLQSQFTNLQAIIGKPTFDILKTQTDNLLQSLNRNEQGIKRTAIALGEVTGNVVELISTDIVAFVDSLDFASLEQGVNNLNSFVETLRVAIKTIEVGFKTGALQITIGLLTKNFGQLSKGIIKLKDADLGAAFNEIASATDEARQRQKDYLKTVDDTASAQSSFNDSTKQQIDDFLAQGAAADQAKQGIDGYKNSLKQAETLQLSFTRAAEDSALKLVRANEDIARSQGRSTAKLADRQSKDRDKLLKDQTKQLDKFDVSRQKKIAKAEADIQKKRKKAAEQRKKDQQKLQRDLASAQEKFNLSLLQSERRFALSERRLIAEGDILAIQELREDRDLARQEEKENFNVSQKDRVVSASEKQKEQGKDLRERVNELKSGLEDQRAELLQSFDEQLQAQVESQALAKAEQQRGFEEAAADRAIALAREEEDRRISQARQLEDLGRSLADQEGVTAEGSAAIADELEKVFGIDGVATNIMTGFTDKTESDFKSLFENLEEITSKTKIQIPEPSRRGSGGREIFSPGTSNPSTISRLAEFDDGGVVPGPIGSPQVIQAHAGETVLPTHQQSFVMASPVIPTQVLRIEGGMDVKGSGFDNAEEKIVQMALSEMGETLEIAVKRIARKN